MNVKCLHPQFVRRPGGAERLLPCGQCYNCRRRLVRTHQGKALSENLEPFVPEHRNPLTKHFLTLTYRTPPMTVPRRHELGTVSDENGDFHALWNGPFPQRDTYAEDGIKEASGIVKINGEPHWKDSLRLLTFEEIAGQHEHYLIEKCGWSYDQLNRWLEGDYQPQQTTRVKDLQQFMDRVRKWHKRQRPDRPAPRYLWATEYGGVTLRPHAHIMLWGVDIQDLPTIYAFWQDYNENGHVHPSLPAAMRGASLLEGRAATYQAKDLVKGKSHYRYSPEQIEIEPPRVAGSKSPPIGDGMYRKWLEQWILPNARIADKTRPPRWPLEHWMVYKIREAAAQLHLPNYEGKNQTFPTTQRWRNKLRDELQIDPNMWDLITEQGEIVGQIETEMIRSNDYGKGEELQSHLEQLRKNSGRIQSKEEDRVRKKRARLVSNGLIQPHED